MADTIQPINVEKIMEEIRQEIKEKGYDASMLSFQEIDGADEKGRLELEEHFSMEELERRVQEANMHATVPWYYPVEGNALACFVKKVIRKFGRFMLIPVVETQNESNHAMVRCLNQLLACVKAQQETIEALQGQLKELQDQN
ncbi:hypothetical protein [Hominifimenecus sp. rT4P-3]|uniref:hypothetical protein n=1 Tax=Hominifimenecus sp. rT4P-3 TaxID=3242979 RepID=UPI003DA35ADC